MMLYGEILIDASTMVHVARDGFTLSMETVERSPQDETWFGDGSYTLRPIAGSDDRPIAGSDEGPGMLIEELLDQSTLDYVARVRARK